MSPYRGPQARRNTSAPETTNPNPGEKCTKPSKRSENRSSVHREFTQKQEDKSKANKALRVKSALKSLGVDPEALASFPKLEPILRLGCGSFRKAISILEADDSDDARAIVEVWRGLTNQYKGILPCEAVVIAAQLSSRRFIEVLTGAIMQQSQDATRMMVAAAQPKVSETMIRRATKRVPIRDSQGNLLGWEEGDFKAQELFHKITGMLPIPKGSQTIIQMAQIGGESQAPQLEESDEPKELQTMDEMLMDMQDVVRPQLQTPRPANTAVPTNAPEVQYLDV